jgi:hypothetical protein
LRGQRLAAARDGKRIKEALERAVALDPGLRDAHFGIGLYHYYAGVAPAAVKVLRWLLLLPGGDRAQGLSEMLRAREDGQLLRSEADYQLHLIYLWYERRPDLALQLVSELRDRHPRNPHFLQRKAEIEEQYLHDSTASLTSWETLLEAARNGRVAEPRLAETRARLGIALQLDRLFETDAALEHLREVIAMAPRAPAEAKAQAQLQLGLALDRLGFRPGAMEAYRAAGAQAPEPDSTRIRSRAMVGLHQAPDPTTASAYRLSLDGWRAVQRGALAEAASALSQSLRLRPDDPVTRYRQAQLERARRNEAAALERLEGIARDSRATPPTIRAAASLEAGQIHEARGDRERAIELYRIASQVFGADQRTKHAAERARARLAADQSTL